MPPLPRKENRRKGGLLVPIALAGAVVAGVAVWVFSRRRSAPPSTGAVLVASTAPGQPEIV
jgi:hypothetical protein